MKNVILIILLSWVAPLVTWSQMGAPIGNDLGTEALTEREYKGIFLGNKSLWNNGNTVVVVLPSSNSEGFEMVAEWALDASGFEYQKHWLSLVFQGRSNAPVFLENEASVIKYVREHPGAIGILYSTAPPEELELKVK
ncbi:hypothetical protein N9C70_03910 [Flavobacteriales bacterium]|mgnify:CR=1 FL=1|jgi:ABC-type phosphate transport system substrate-binding protein|nr:hypothetical protein [Flavobacteriales bacterium]MDA9864194.1 hypothetical protein [Flavobacteriales bacterium]